jgi:hypothetical protein
VKPHYIPLIDEDSGKPFLDSQNRPQYYIPLENRVPEFLEAYPPKEGYRVSTETLDLLSVRKGLLSVFKEAIAAGRKVSDLGLMGLDQTLTTLVCTARLFDPEGRELRSASASGCLLEPKDFERLESAAVNRLISALGFDGHISWEEVEAMKQAATATQPNHSVSLARGASPEAETPGERRERIPLVALPEEADPGTSAATAAPAAGISKALRSQVTRLAARLGESVPELKTQEDAGRELRRLGELSASRLRDQRNGSGAVRAPATQGSSDGPSAAP